MREKIKLGELLVKNGLLSPEKLNEALELQKNTKEKQRLGKILVELNLISYDKICDCLSTQLNIPKVDLTKIEFSFFDKRLEPIIKKRMVIPLTKNNTTIVLAMADPLDVIAIDDVRRITGCEVKPVVAPEPQIQEAIKRYEACLMVEELEKKDSRISKFVDEMTRVNQKPFSIDSSVFLEATKSVLTPKTFDIELEDILGEVLVRKGIITQSQLDIAKSQRKNEKLGDILVQLKFTNRGRILTVLTQILFRI